MSDETRIEVSPAARTALNVLAIRAIEVAQRANQGASRIDPIGIRKSLDEIERRVREARQEIADHGILRA